MCENRLPGNYYLSPILITYPQYIITKATNAHTTQAYMESNSYFGIELRIPLPIMSNTTAQPQIIWVRYDTQQEIRLRISSFNITVDELKDQILSSKKLPQIQDTPNCYMYVYLNR